MLKPARRSMTIAEFLTWDDGTDTRYELVGGVPMAMNPPSAVHQRVASNAFAVIERTVASRRPCRAVVDAGLQLSDDPEGDAWIPDVLMTCEPVDDRALFKSPALVVEVLSRATDRYDQHVKLVGYGRLASLQEIWLVGGRRRFALIFRREGDEWRASLPVIGRAGFASPVLGREVALDELYELTPLAEEPEPGHAGDASRDQGIA